MQTGTVAPLATSSGVVSSAIVKCPVTGPVLATHLGLVGDQQGDARRHGGQDKAICVFALEHYESFGARLDRVLDRPAFGENLTTAGLLETDVCLGDVLLVGHALCEVSLPRNPCFRVGALHGDKRVVLWMERTGATGFYLRVLRPGTLEAGAPITITDRRHPQVTVAEANRVMHRDRRDLPAIARLLAVPALGPSWRHTFERRLAGEIEDRSARRHGRLPRTEGEAD